MNILSLSSGSRRISREALRQVPTPEATESWKPVPHHEVTCWVTAMAQSRNYRIVSEEYTLAANGKRMFGILRFHPEGHPEFSRALGLRNSHDRSFALGLTAGFQVTVCANLAFGGETAIRRRHTKNIEVAPLLAEAFDRLELQYLRLELKISQLKEQYITLDAARLLIVQAAELKAIPSSSVLAVLDEFKNPSYPEFADSTCWSLYNSFTQTAKQYRPVRAEQCYRKLAKLFELT